MSLYPYRHRKQTGRDRWRTGRNVLATAAAACTVAGVVLLAVAPVGWWYLAIGLVCCGVCLLLGATVADRHVEETAAAPPVLAYQPTAHNMDSAPTTPLGPMH